MNSTLSAKEPNYKLRSFLFRWGISAPGLLAQIIFGWMPLIIGILVSFQDFNFQRSEWCGLDNYRAVVNDPMTAPYSVSQVRKSYALFNSQYLEDQGRPASVPRKAWFRVQSLFEGFGLVWRNTITYVTLTLCLVFFIPIIVSILLMEMKPWMIRVMMILWFVPISGMASIILLKYYYNVDYGLLNGLLAKFYEFIGKPVAEWEFPRYLNSPDTAMLCLVIPNIILFSPGLVYITALQGIPQDLYDAAEIDGCGFVQKIWNVTLPRLRPIIVTMLIFAVLGAFQILNEVMIMTGGGPGNKTMVMGYYIYKMTFDYIELGKGNALAVMFFCFLMILTVFQRIYIKEETDHGEDKKTKKLVNQG